MRRMPAAAAAWNRVRLAVAGDGVTVALNGTPVYERPIEPTNQRLFGLFHYTDRTEARVRGMTLTGDWPKQLPPAERLFEAKKGPQVATKEPQINTETTAQTK